MQEALEATLSSSSAEDTTAVAPEEVRAADGPGAVLQEDTTLDEELDAASGAPLVETERDRLIRLVCFFSWTATEQIGRMSSLGRPVSTGHALRCRGCTVQGVLTPFDRLDGFERRVQPQSAAARSAGQASTSGDSSTFLSNRKAFPDRLVLLAPARKLTTGTKCRVGCVEL